MARKKNTAGDKTNPAKSFTIASNGITTGQDFANFMSALMADVICGAVSSSTANAACNAGGKLLKVVELQLKHGTPDASGSKVINLALKQPLLPQDSKVQ